MSETPRSRPVVPKPEIISSVARIKAPREWQHVFDAIEDAIFLLDLDYRVLLCNKASLKMFNRMTPDEMIGRHCWEIVHGTSAPIPQCPTVAMMKTKKRESSVFKSGERWLRTTVDPLLDENGNISGSVKIVCDITKEKLADAEREKAESQIRQSQKMETIGQLAGGIAHDFNNQLMGIMGCAEFLYSQLDDADLKGEVENILQASRRASDLTSKLLAFSRKGKYLVIPVDIHKLIGEIIAILEHSIDKRIEIRRGLKADPAVVKGDPTQLQNALLNLAINARDALPSGGEISFTTEIVRSEDVPCGEGKGLPTGGRYLEICVCDDGIGMDDETVQRMFEPFFTTKPMGKGTGMGLAAVYGTVKSHNGFISASSCLGEGTVCRLFLPILEEKECSENAAGTAPVPVSTKSRILLSDDDEVVRNIVSSSLRSLGHDVITCKDGMEAVEYYQSHWKETDLVILDMMMPVMNGKDAFYEMRSINRNIRSLLISGFSIDGEAQELINAGMKGFLQKPFGIKELSAAVEAALKEA
ncbi:MAG: response regulator [Victivallales bacterium]